MSHDNLNAGTIIKLRRDTAANWTIDNPVLAVGETGWETDSRRVKLGDGVTAWVDLPYAADEAASVAAEQARAEAAEAALQTAINTEATTRGNADTALDTRVDAIEATEATYGDIVTHNASEFAGADDPPRAAQGQPPLTPHRTAVTTFQSGHGWIGAGFASVTDDTTDFFFGTQSAKVVTDTAGTSATFDSPTYTAIDFTGKEIAFALKITGVADLADLRLYVGNSTFSNARNINFKPIETGGSDFQFIKEGEWSWFTISPDAGSAIGTPNKAAITKFRFRIEANSATAVTVRFGGMFSQDRPYAAAFPNGAVSFTYDDGRTTGYDVGRAKLEQYGWRGTFYPIWDRLGQGGGSYVTVQDLVEALARGHEIACHANTQADHNLGFTELGSLEAVEADLIAERNNFYANALGNVGGFAWPRGMSDIPVEGAASKVVTYGRGTYTAAGNNRETLPPANPMRLRAYGVGASTTLPDLQTFVDATIARGEWVIFVFHEIRPTLLVDGAPESLQSVHDGIIDYIAGLTTKPVVLPVMDVIRQMPTPALTDIPLSGDLTGTLSSATVAKINGAAVSGTPTSGKVLTGTGIDASWQPISGVDTFSVNNRITAGEGTFPRMLATGSQSTSSQNLLLTYFTAEVTETITQIALGTATIAAAATPSLIRAGIYSIDASTGDATLIASTPNDTTLFAATNTKYTKSFSSSWNKVAGNRYALGLLVVSAATMPNYPGISMLGPSNFATAAPRLAASISGQTDLPGSYLGAGLTSQKFLIYAELLR